MDLVQISKDEVVEAARKYVKAKVALREPCAPNVAKHPAVEPYFRAEQELFEALALLEEREKNNRRIQSD